MKQKKFFAALLCAVSSFAHAASDSLDEVVVTAARTEQAQLMLDQIERIEVVRGNVSSLYGSEAIGGVIQIFTKHGKGAPAFSASAGYGTHATRCG